MTRMAIITPEFLRLIAVTWSEQQLRAGVAVLADLLHDKRGAVSLPECELELVDGAPGGEVGEVGEVF